MTIRDRAGRRLARWAAAEALLELAAGEGGSPFWHADALATGRLLGAFEADAELAPYLEESLRAVAVRAEAHAVDRLAEEDGVDGDRDADLRRLLSDARTVLGGDVDWPPTPPGR